jgi:putative hydrolase of the HAD superfamily
MSAIAQAISPKEFPTLFLDADDTLWENNIFFERAIADFLSLLDHTLHSPHEVRSRLNAIEAEHVRTHGYGTVTFERSLLRCYTELSTRVLSEEDRQRIHAFARSVCEAEIELMPGVAQALPRLAGRFRLVLVTKGDHAEQADKLARSGLAHYFDHVEIVHEKDAEAYRSLITRLGLDPGSTWMIGNSPRSDINPALEAGLHAAFVRYHAPWALEEAPLAQPAPGQQLLSCASLAEVAELLLAPAER